MPSNKIKFIPPLFSKFFYSCPALLVSWPCEAGPKDNAGKKGENQIAKGDTQTTRYIKVN